MQKSPGMANSISSVGMRTIGIQQCILFVQHAFSLPRLYCCCSTIVVVVVVFFIIFIIIYWCSTRNCTTSFLSNSSARIIYFFKNRKFASQSKEPANRVFCCWAPFPPRPWGGSGSRLQNILWILTHGQDPQNCFTNRYVRILDFLYFKMAKCDLAQHSIEFLHFQCLQKCLFKMAIFIQLDFYFLGIFKFIAWNG